MYYIESGVAPLDTNSVEPHTQQFQQRLKRKWSVISPLLLHDMGLQDVPPNWITSDPHRIQEDNESKYRNCRSVCNKMYAYKEHKWISKHKFMICSPLIYPGIKALDSQRRIRLPSDVLRRIFVCLHGHGP